MSKFELRRIEEAYARRESSDFRYSCFSAGHLLMLQERERYVLDLLQHRGFSPLSGKRILEIGCGTGYWLREFVKWGASPEHVFGVDLILDRTWQARQLCPPGVGIVRGNAAELPFKGANFDLVLQFTVFTSVLDQGLRQKMALEILRVVKPGGLVLWYDFCVNNPRNSDVRGVKKCEIEGLFAGCQIRLRRITLAPPLARWLAPRSWTACHLLAKLPWLCTHYLGLISKATDESLRP